MDWRTFLRDLPDDYGELTFSAPVDEQRLVAAEAALSTALPTDLRELLQQTNGVEGEYGLGVVWPIERIVEDNRRFRSEALFIEIYASFESLLFFGDAGNGDQFAFPIEDGRGGARIFVWNHEDDARTCIAISLEDFLRRWLTGALKI